jgi:hypothetical protein
MRMLSHPQGPGRLIASQNKIMVVKPNNIDPSHQGIDFMVKKHEEKDDCSSISAPMSLTAAEKIFHYV